MFRPIQRPIYRAIASGLLTRPGGFSPVSLFTDGSKGVLYDNNDLSSFFLDSALTTPATVNGLVGGQLDKSGNGFHRTQATTGSKPVLRGTPTGANLVTNGDFATDTVWNKGADWTIGSGVATKTAGSATSLTQAYSPSAGRVYRFTYTITVSAGGVQPYFTGGTGVFGTLRTASGTYVEWLTAATGNNLLGFTTNAAFAGTIDNVEVVDVSADSVTAPYGLHYDGVDDFMQTAAVDFTATDKMFVCAGVRKLSDSAQGIVAELTASLAANNGSFYLSAPNSAAANYAFASKGTISATDIESGFTAPHLAVITGIGNISGDSAQLRTNGVAGATVTTDQGTGNYGNYVIYFGRRGGVNLPYNGLDFGMVICGKTLTSTQISQTERYIAQRTGVTI